MQIGLYKSDTFLLNYVDNSETTDFNITSTTGVTSNVYYSFGLSNDQNMVVYYWVSDDAFRTWNLIHL